MNKYIIHSDGGARGNPGPAAIGYTIEGNNLNRFEFGQYIGETTNNDAEYRAAISALNKLVELIGENKCLESEVELRMDSELVVKQMRREYKVKHPNLKILFNELWNLTSRFKSVSFVHVRREQNSGADELVNKSLDAYLGL